MAGYTPEKTIYKLVFDDMEGLVVRARSATIGEITEFNHLLGFKAAQHVAAGMPVADAEEESKKPLVKFIDFLVDWNVLDDNGDPVPATLAGVSTQEPTFMWKIINAWMTAGSAPAPLEQPSSDGEQSLEASIPMEPLSPSLAS
ncbi:MAG: hypothetical protein ACREJC_17610 [Tepidisphaeraceae bacterium]